MRRHCVKSPMSIGLSGFDRGHANDCCRRYLAFRTLIGQGLDSTQVTLTGSVRRMTQMGVTSADSAVPGHRLNAPQAVIGKARAVDGSGCPSSGARVDAPIANSCLNS
jgi:hypothetical protein